MTLEQAAQMVQIAGGLSVVAAIAFGVSQLRQYRQGRRDTAGIELMRIIQDGEFLRAFRTMYSLPEGISAGQLRAMGTEVEESALIIGARFETLGLLVYRHNIPFDMMAEQVGGVAVDSWRILRTWVADQRRQQNQPLFLEWFQWLAERLEENGRPRQQPAYERCRHWNPP